MFDAIPGADVRNSCGSDALVRTRRRPDVRIAVPRFADVIGPTVITPLTRYFSLAPVVPMVLGRDARLQLVHELDAVGAMELLAVGDFSGTVNIAGEGAITLAQAIHRAGRIPLPVPSLGLDPLSRTMRTLRMGGFSPSQVKLLAAGRVMDTTRLIEQVGFVPQFSTIAAFDDFAASLRPVLAPATVRRAEVRIAGTFGAQPRPVEQAPDSRAERNSTIDVDPAEPVETGREPTAVGRPRLVGITGEVTGAPRRRRTR